MYYNAKYERIAINDKYLGQCSGYRVDFSDGVLITINGFFDDSDDCLAEALDCAEHEQLVHVVLSHNFNDGRDGIWFDRILVPVARINVERGAVVGYTLTLCDEETKKQLKGE